MDYGLSLCFKSRRPRGIRQAGRTGDPSCWWTIPHGQHGRSSLRGWDLAAIHRDRIRKPRQRGRGLWESRLSGRSKNPRGRGRAGCSRCGRRRLNRLEVRPASSGVFIPCGRDRGWRGPFKRCHYEPDLQAASAAEVRWGISPSVLSLFQSLQNHFVGVIREIQSTQFFACEPSDFGGVAGRTQFASNRPAPKIDQHIVILHALLRIP
jgi:hypothetical protein